MAKIHAFVETDKKYATNNPHVGKLITARPFIIDVQKDTTFRDIWDHAARKLGLSTKKAYAVYAQLDDDENFFWVVSEKGGFATYLIGQPSSFPRQYDELILKE